ncbi:MAG: hypothetical protein WA853_20480 [Candidatus Acidiferrum sp.]
MSATPQITRFSRPPRTPIAPEVPLATNWMYSRESDLKAAIHARGLGLAFDFDEVPGSGYLWQRPASLCFIYAYDCGDGIHVPGATGEEVVASFEEAEALIRKFVLSEFGETL